jgi:hypothetical protein
MKNAEAVKAAVGGHDLNAVIGAFERWRAEKRPGEKIPQRLWQAAVSLHPRYSVYQISRACPPSADDTNRGLLTLGPDHKQNALRRGSDGNEPILLE